MHISKRSKYKVIRDFVARMPMANASALYTYVNGDIVILRDEGKYAIRWLREGLITKLEEENK